MSPETSNTPNTKVCPTCGTRLAESATRCLVCGTELSASAEMKKPQAIQANRMPEITLSLPAALGLLALFLVIGAVLVFFVLRVTGVETTDKPVVPTATVTLTATITYTPTEQPTNTPIPTSTTQPPFDHTVSEGEFCSTIAATFGISVQSIIILNNLSANCILSAGKVLKIPYPTPTIALLPTVTQSAQDEVVSGCGKEIAIYVVQDGDSLSGIAANYAVPMEAIKIANNLISDNVFFGASLTIPLCKRAPTPGPSPTATTPPPYPAPNLLLPPDGASFALINETVSLQWASVGALRINESYMVIIEDVTDEQGRRMVDYVTDTKYIIPSSFRPKDGSSHIFRWWITTARQSGGVDDQGLPLWDVAGAASLQRVFNWQGAASAQPTPTP